MGLRTVVLLGAAACRISSVDVAGKACPCPGGWYCDPATDTCSLTAPATDAFAADTARQTYRDAVMSDAPAGYWRLGDAGAMAHDETGGHDGTYTGTCAHGVGGALVGDPDKAVLFDGQSCEIELPSAYEFPGTAAFSVEAWIDVAGPILGYAIVVSEATRNGSGPLFGYNLVDSGSGVYLERAIAGATVQTPKTAHAFGRFVYLVAVYDGAEIVLYIDGTPTAPAADARSLPAYSEGALIGADAIDNWFVGTIDEVAIYDHVLAADRIAAHLELGTGGPK